MASAKIVIPCYNEEARLDLSCFKDFKSSLHQIRFLFVNDGSTDQTRRLLESLCASDPTKFALLDLQSNKGKAEAVRRGILTSLNSYADYVGFWDADLATPLDAIPEFVSVAESRPTLEMVFGARVKLLGRRIQRRTFRHYSGRVFATLVSTILRLPVYDTQCGAKIFRVSPLLKALFQEPFQSRWIFDVEILARLIQARRGAELLQPEAVIYEFPLVEWRDIPDSKLTYSDFVKAVWELGRIYSIYSRRKQSR